MVPSAEAIGTATGQGTAQAIWNGSHEGQQGQGQVGQLKVPPLIQGALESNHRGLIRQRQIPVCALQPEMSLGRQLNKQLIGGWPSQGEIRIQDAPQILEFDLTLVGDSLLALTLGLGQSQKLIAEGEALGVEDQRAQIESPAGGGHA